MQPQPPPLPPPPLSPVPPNAAKPGIGLLLTTTLAVLLSMGLSFAKAMRATGEIPEALGEAVGAFVFAVIVTALFSISPRFRNARSRTNIMLWTSVIIIVARLGNPGH